MTWRSYRSDLSGSARDAVVHVYDGTVQAGGPDDAGDDPSTFGRNLFWYEYLKKTHRN